ncbi:MAG: hypothetical protein GYB67_15340 [Chloroflexi bacterium]|nr:hypothetical protein [Chloroflexota bacterium]
MITLLVHINNAEPIKLDVDTVPEPTDSVLIGKNPREKTEREVGWIEDGVTTIVLPWHRINYIEILPAPSDETEFPMPFRDS